MKDGSSWVPLGTVKTYREGILRLQGWITFSVLCFFTAGLVVMYEVRRSVAVNLEDRIIVRFFY